MTVKKEVKLKSDHKLSEIDKFQICLNNSNETHNNVCTKPYVSFHGAQLNSLFLKMSLFV